MNKLLLGALYGVIAQIFTFLQLQGGIKYDWNKKYPITILLVSIPISWLFIKSVGYIVEYYNGLIYPSRLIGFGIGIIIFVTLSMILFKEPLTLKTITCLLLAASILLVQIFWK
jgi:multidrug transporter EmrE-like cation transporter